MSDPTETQRKFIIDNKIPEACEEAAPERFDTTQLQELFEVHGFLAPFVSVTRKADGVRGTMMFTHSPRRYFNFVPSE
jgi:hypothetical protein